MANKNKRCALLALWNACPVKCEAYLTGAKPIPLGLYAFNFSLLTFYF